MKLTPYVERLNSSDEYKEFKKKYTDSFMVAGFFILDMEAGKNIHQLDYFIPSEKKIAAFTLDGPINLQILDALTKKAPEKIDMKARIDLDELKGILQDEMKNRSITEEIKKVIAILQSIDGKKIWNVNCVLSGMGILRAHIEDESKTVLKMEKASLFDYMKRVTPDMVAKQPTTKKEMKEELDKLNKLEEEIEKQKEKLQQGIKKEKKKP